MNKKLKFVFLVSILANILLVGFLVGELPQRFDRGSRRGERMKRDLEKLPEPVRTQFREKMDEMRRTAGPVREKMSQERAEALRILAADPFDEAAYDRQVKKIQELRLRMAQRISDNVKEIAKGLPQEQRKALAEVLKRPPPGPPR